MSSDKISTMDVSTRQLRAFRLVAQHRNFTRAAETLFITPSGLSVLIKELEGRVGFRLFERTTRHVELTAHGRELLVVIQRSLEELDAGIASIARSVKSGQQQISLGTTPLVAANILPPAMREFRRQRPDVRIQLFDADLPTLINRVEAGELDMSLGIFKAMADVRREPFFRFSLMVVRAAKDDVPTRRTTNWSSLAGETLISLTSDHPHQQLIDKHLAQASVAVQIGSVVNLLDTQIALVEAEEGIAIIPSFGMPACRNRKVVMSQLINPVVRFDFHLISRRGRALPPGAEEFTSFLKSYVATWAGRTGVL
jgi:LysR family carnitine catabolism transcriptional activator